jgi:uncharacterized HAD superfamily protein
MRIAVDLDNTIFDFCGEFLRFSNIRFSHDDKICDIDRWDFWNSPNIKLTKDEFDKGFMEFTENKCWHAIPIFPDAKFALCSLSSMGHSIYYMTDRPKNARRATLKALLGNGLPIDSVLFIGFEDKASVAKQLKIDIAIDDKPETIELFRKAGIVPVIRRIEHNFSYIEKNNLTSSFSPIKVCNNMTEFMKVVEELEKKKNLDKTYKSIKKLFD